MITQDMHLHTVYSHGHCTPTEVAAICFDRGLKQIAISEHGYSNMFYGVSDKAYLKLYDEILSLRDFYGTRMRILLGTELNLLGNGKTDIPKSLVPDINILGYHRGIFPGNRFRISALYQSFACSGKGKSISQTEKNTDEYIRAISENKISIICHPGEYIPINIERLSKAAAELNVLLEINNRHNSLSVDDIKKAASCGAQFIISSDAHLKKEVAFYDNAIKIAKEADVLKLVYNWRNDS